MLKTAAEQRLARLRARLNELHFWVDAAWFDLDGWQFNGAALAVRDRWPGDYGVVIFAHPPVTLPSEWTLEYARLDLDLGGEGLVRLGYDDGVTESFGLDPQHQRFPLRFNQFSIEAEVVARLPFGRPNRDPKLVRARVTLTEPAVERLVRLIRLIIEAVQALGSHDVVDPLLAAAERAFHSLDWPSASEPYISRVASSEQMQSIWALPSDLDSHPAGLTEEQRRSVTTAADLLEKSVMALQTRYPAEGAIALTGHAHIDLAWLWPLEETRRKAQRSFYTVIGLMDRFPELRFVQSTAQLYAYVEQDDPALFARIKEKVAAGQWEPIGGMWVEPDINMPCGESLVRQLLYGQRYFQRTFGTAHTVCWLPDCFGFSPALPQLLRGAGIENFFTIKLTWSETNRFPYDLFWWEGLDGSRVLAHMFNNPDWSGSGTGGYNGDSGPWATVNTWREFRGKHAHGESLLSIGYGDGGGGVTPEMVEQVRVLDAFPAIPVARFTSVQQFYERMRATIESRALPVWLGEMYLELHRGTLTSQGRTKYLHRRAERDLSAAEALAALHHLLGGPEPRSLEEHWQVVLRNEFHDILPGSSIREVYEEACSELTDVVRAASANIEQLSGDLASTLVTPGDRIAVLALNPDLTSRPLRLELTEHIPGGQDAAGAGSVLTGPVTVPGLGAAITFPAEPAYPVSIGANFLENEYLRVELAVDGSLTSVYDKRAGRETLAGRGNQLWAFVDKPANWDAWDIDSTYPDAGEELATPESISVIERGPHRGVIRLVRRFRHSTVTQDVRLWTNSPRLEFRTTLDWHDRRWLLKARFPLAIRSSHATFETAFGVIERPTHRNTTWEAARFEVAGHRFADLSEPGYGVALLNDGKYGYHAVDNELGLSLLRSPAYPDPLADEGSQTFTYALLPHTGTWFEGGVLMEAEDLNRPLLGRAVLAGREETRQIVTLAGVPLGLGALKVLEDGGGLALRVYEPQGARGATRLELPSGWHADTEMDLLEQEAGETAFEFTPFQIRTWRLRRRS